MDIRKIKKLIEMISESDVAEIEIHEGEDSLRISRYSSMAPAAVQVVQAPVAQPVSVHAPAEAGAEPAREPAQPRVRVTDDGERVHGRGR